MKICNKCNEEKATSEFTPCKGGKLGVLAVCKKCKAKYSAEQRANNRDSINARRKEVPSAKKKSEYDAKYLESHRDEINARRRQCRKDNPERFKAQYERHKKTQMEGVARRRVRKNALIDSMPKDFMKILTTIYGPNCMNPKCPYEMDDWNIITHDHIIPISSPGSSHSLENSQLLCRKCNISKGNRHSTDYRVL